MLKDIFYEYETIATNRTVVQLIAHFRVVWIGHNGKTNVAAKTPVKIKKEIYMLMMGLVPGKDMQTPPDPPPSETV